MKKPQWQRLLESLQDGKIHTHLSALMELGIARVTNRISDLEKMGYGIVRGEMDTAQGKCMTYRMLKEAKQEKLL